MRGNEAAFYRAGISLILWLGKCLSDICFKMP